MRQFLRSTLAACLAASLTGGIAAEAASRAYGIQIYSESEPTAKTKLVSFSIDDPSKVREEQDFSAYNILAAACNDGTYYFLHSDDELTPSKLVSYDMKRKEFKDIASYDVNTEMAGLIVLDMTYDSTMECLYAVAADISKGEMVDGQLNAPFGLYSVDPATGGTELVGLQEMTVIVAIAAGDYELWGVDEEGNLWIMDKYSGMLQDIMASTGIEARGTQSMAYDSSSNTYYWASYSADPESGDDAKGLSNLISFHLTEDWDLQTEELGKIGGNAELIGLYIDSNPLDENAPAYAADFKATPAEGGKAEVTLTWTNPTLTIGGSPLEGTLTAVIARNEENVAEVEGNPGEPMSWTDKEAGSALYTYSVTMRAGDAVGAPVYTEPVFVGADVPGAPSSIEAARTGEGFAIKVSWNAPEKGAEGGWFDSSDLRYNVVRYPDGKVIAESTAELELIDSDITVQEGYYYGVKAINGTGFGPEALSKAVVSGPALNPPYTMTLDERDTNLWSVWNGDGDSYEWYVYRTGWGGTWDPFFRYYPEDILDPDGIADDWIFSPYFAFEKGKKYVVTYDLRLLGDLFPASTSLWIGCGATPSGMNAELHSEEKTYADMDWITRTVPVTVDEDGTYNFGIKVSNLVPVQLYKFTVRESADYDLEAISLTGPTTVSASTPFAYEVKVKNTGFETVEAYTVSLVDSEGTVLAEKKIDEAIPAGEVVDVAVEWTPAAEGQMEISAVVKAEGDAIASNDITAPLSVQVLGDGTWIDITDGNSSSGFTPIYARAHYSAAQSIYPADMIGRPEGCSMKAATYYIASFRGEPIDIDLELWAGNTELEDFSADEPIDEDEMTLVFDGKVTITPGEQTITVAFDKTFEYAGGNLVLFTRHASESTASIAFKARYVSSEPNHSLVAYSDVEPFFFGQAMIGQRDLPDVSLLSGDGAGVEAVEAEGLISYDRASRRLLVGVPFKTLRIYDALGATLKVFSSGEDLIVPAGIEGVCIVEAAGESGRSVAKIKF